MRRILSVVFIALFSAWSLSAQEQPDNWSVESADLSIEKEEVTVNDGTYAAKSSWTSDSNQDFDSDSFTFTPGSDFTLSVDVYDDDDAGRVRLAIIWDGSNDYSSIYSVDQGSWQTLTYTDAVPAGATEAFVRFRFYDETGWDGDAEVILDNVSFTIDAGSNELANASFETWSTPVIPEYTIAEIQGDAASSPYDGETVTTHGIVTGSETNGYFIQDGYAAWNGIYVHDDVNIPAVGDSLTITGEVNEFYDRTCIESVTAYTVNSQSNELPDAVTLSTANAAQEMYEGVLISISEAACTATEDGNGEWTVDDGSGELIVDDLMFAYSPALDNEYNITGILEYSYSNYKIEPRDADDIEDLGNPADNVSITEQPGDTAICEGESIEFVVVAEGAEPFTYEWYLDGDMIPDSDNDTLVATEAGEYTCEISNAGSSATTEAWTLSISIPEVELGEDASYCTGYDVTLDAGSFESYEWGSGEDTQTIMPDESGTYAVVVTDMYGCTATDTVEVTFDSEWTPELPDDVTVCENTTLTITLPEADAYIWSTNETTQSIEVDTSANLYVTITQGTCVVVDSITVEWSASPEEFDLGDELYYCEDDTVTLQGPDGSFNYLWSTDETTQSIEVSETDNYVLTIYNSEGCATSDMVYVEFNNYLVVNIGDTIYSCEGETVTLEPVQPGDSLTWNDESHADSLNVSENGWYYLTVTDTTGGCEGEDSVWVEFNALPEITLDEDTAFCNGNTLTITAPEAEAYLWNTEETSQSIEATEGGTYTVTITDENGCMNSDNRALTVWPLPNIDLGPDQIITEDQTVIFAVETGHDTYAWSTGETTDLIVVSGEELGVGTHTISVTVTSANECVNYDEVELTVIEGAGINDAMANAVEIYPNPATDMFRIDFNDYKDALKIQLIDTNARILKEIGVDSGLLEIDAGNFAKGIYFIRIIGKEQSLTKKLVIR